ncbi:hypothetical protein ACFWN7_11460 [Agromyces sp. NPDC058484]|uniref:hypothetical protein n=1 Tax=Agromyces sp. NPDC058484 TaxID=3346524 RepID=UPI003664337B
MRTTLDLDPAVLRAARALADQRGLTLGSAVSELALRGLRAEATQIDEGFPLLPRFVADHVVTDDLVALHRDGE